MKRETQERYFETLGKVLVVMLLLTITVPLFSHRFGNLSFIIVWGAWIQVVLYVHALTQAATAVYTVKKYVRSGVGWVDWSMPPYPRLFRNAAGTLAATILMLGFAFNFFGIFGNIESTLGVWLFFLLGTFFGMTWFSKTGSAVYSVYQNIAEVEKYSNSDQITAA